MRGFLGKALLFVAALAALAAPVSAQAILGSAAGSNQAIVFPSPGTGLPNPTQLIVPGLPAGAQPHGVSYYGSNNALVSDALNGRVFVVQISTATLVDTIDVSAAWDAAGTIAVAPGLNFALGCGSSATLAVIAAPFQAGATINQVTLPGSIATYQTEAIVFNAAGRAFVYNTSGISVLDPPYNAIAFTIPAANSSSGSIAVSPDGNTLLTTDLSSGNVSIFTGPFSASTTPTTLAIPGGTTLDGIAMAPNGATALVVSAGGANIFAIAAPFSSSSTVETITINPSDGSFEDIGISADSQLAIATGNAAGNNAPFIQAPFTAAGATVSDVAITGGRGAGAVRFLPPGLAPGLTISKSGPPNADPGTNITYTITYGNTGGASATNVVIQDPVPTGTTFVSATGGGTQAGGVVTWNIGTVPAGTSGLTVSFTVTVNAASGTIANVNYTIAADGIPPIAGPPVFTQVGGAPPTPTPPPGPTPTPQPGPTATVPTLSNSMLALLGIALAAIAFLVLRRQG